MKVKISYEVLVSREIELTPEEYCYLRANFNSRPDIFPSGTFRQKLQEYEDMDRESQKELEKFWDRD